MFEQILQQMRQKIRQQQYVMTLHADEEMADDNLMLADVEEAILTGEILERQKDIDRDEWKYRISGFSIDGAPVEVVAKLGVTGKVVIITVYAL